MFSHNLFVSFKEGKRGKNKKQKRAHHGLFHSGQFLPMVPWIHGSYDLGFVLGSYGPSAHLLSLFHFVEDSFLLDPLSFLDVCV